MSERNFIVERLVTASRLDAKSAPATIAIFLGKKYLLPAKRQADYFDQGTINRITLGGFLETAFTGELQQSARAEFVNLMLAVKCGRPTFFLERELAEIFLESQIPEDLTIDDVQTQFPSFRIMFPSKILNLGEYWATCADVAIWNGSKLEIEFPPVICKETGFQKSNFSFVDRNGIGHLLISVYMNGGPFSYNTTKPWQNGKLTNILDYQFDDSNSFSTIETDDERLFLRRIEAFTFNLLLFLSGIPAEYKREEIVRKAKTIGKNLRPALAQAKFIGDYMVRAKALGRVKGELTGQTKAAHWVRPHWRRQPHGPARTLRKLIWILPYHTGAEVAT